MFPEFLVVQCYELLINVMAHCMRRHGFPALMYESAGPSSPLQNVGIDDLIGRRWDSRVPSCTLGLHSSSMFVR